MMGVRYAMATTCRSNEGAITRLCQTDQVAILQDSGNDGNKCRQVN